MLTLIHGVDPLGEAGRVASEFAAQRVFADYRERKAENTVRRQDNGLTLFADYLAVAGIPNPPSGAALATDGQAWRGVSWGLVSYFARWLLDQGYAVGTVNGHLSTIKSYARLAAKAGAIPAGELVLIRALQGWGHTEGKRVDDARAVTRRGSKKADSVSVTPDQAAQLKMQPDTPQGRRDAVLMCLLLDHGLRVGEVVRLLVTDVDLKAGELRFYRPKVDKSQTHRLTPDTLRALRAYFDAGDAPPLGPLLRASCKNHELTGMGMSERGVTGRVRSLGALLGLEGLSAHDLRHCWATRAARNHTALDRLQDAGGWSSPAMPARYIEAAAIANEGVKLG